LAGLSIEEFYVAKRDRAGASFTNSGSTFSISARSP
jgi:hypothetical protein